MSRSVRGLVVLFLGVISVAVLLSACGGGGSSGGSEPASSSEPSNPESETKEADSTESSTSGGAGVEAAKKIVAEYKPGLPLEVERLAKRPPEGIKVADVNCNVPNCQPEALKRASEALGWDYQAFPFNVEKGPQDFTRAFKAAVAAHPEYISVTLTFGEELGKPSLEEATKAGIPVIGVAAENPKGGWAGVIQGTTSQWSHMGEVTSALAISEVGGGAHYAIATDPALTTLDFTLHGMEKQIEENGEEATVESFKVGVAAPPEQNIATTISFLQSHPEVNVLMYTATQLSTGAYQQLKAAGILDHVKIFIPYVGPADLAAIKGGEVTAGVAGEQDYAWRTADMMARLSIGEEITEIEPIGQFRTIHAENANTENLDPPEFEKVWKQAWNVGG